MNVSLWYVLRALRRRPKRYLSLTAVSAAVMVVTILVILWNEAEWRAEVMPDHQDNYHISFYNLTAADKEYIRRQSWVQATYDLYQNTTDPAYANTFRVRVTWEHVADAVGLARTVMLERGLFERAPYAERYQREYENQYNLLLNEWMGAAQRNGVTVEEAAAINARSYVLRYGGIKNTGFINKTMNSYTMQPSFFSFLFMLSMFLGAATTILILETYREDFREYGTLRALGFTQGRIFQVNLLCSLSVTLAAIPTAVLVSAGAVQLYYKLIEPYKAEAAALYFTIDDYVPLSTLALTAGFLLLSALAGTLFVCWFYRTRSVLSLLRGEGTFTVSFVSKTSGAFARARRIGAYNRLYALRARSTLLRFAAIIAIMLPLPMLYLQAGAVMLFDLTTTEKIIQAIYSAFQIAAVLITTLCVTCAASRMSARSRTRELAVFRALGADHRAICRVTFPIATMQGIVILFVALFVNQALNSLTATTYVGSAAGAQSVSELVSMLLVYAVSAIVFVLPSAYSGLLLFLPGFFRRPIMASLRETE